MNWAVAAFTAGGLLSIIASAAAVIYVFIRIEEVFGEGAAIFTFFLLLIATISLLSGFMAHAVGV